MKTSDYIAEFLVKHDIRHCYGYQGTMIAYLVDALCARNDLHNHICRNEQGAAFAAVGEAKISGKVTFAYSTSGPGAMNLINGVCDAFFDSCPVIFVTGQLNTNEYLDVPGIRQHGFQQMDVVSVMKPITKYCSMVTDPNDLPRVLEEAYQAATTGRPGPVLIDLPMNMQRADIDPDACLANVDEIHARMERDWKGNLSCADPGEVASSIIEALRGAKRPVLVLGSFASRSNRDLSRQVVDMLGVPVVTSLLGRDILPYDHPLNFGFIGAAYGHRYANMIVHKKADLIVSLGGSLCKRQTGMRTEQFAKDATILRVDIDPVELSRHIHQAEVGYLCDCADVMRALLAVEEDVNDYSDWLSTCRTIRDELTAYDEHQPAMEPNRLVRYLSHRTKWAESVVVDVGQHQMWVGQSYELTGEQHMIFSGGHGCMGFSLPAAIGAYYATGKPAIALAGDGSMQMNIQEFEWLRKEQVPVTIFVLNNHSLGLIRQQQDSLFAGRYCGAADAGGYSAPSFAAVARAYGLNSQTVSSTEDLERVLSDLDTTIPNVVEVLLPDTTLAIPKTEFGREMHNQHPELPDDLLDRILAM